MLGIGIGGIAGIEAFEPWLTGGVSGLLRIFSLLGILRSILAGDRNGSDTADPCPSRVDGRKSDRIWGGGSNLLGTGAGGSLVCGED